MHNNGRETLRNALISYLQNAAVRYKSLRAGSRQTRPKEMLSPMEGDIVLYKNSDKPPQTRYGLILEILGKNQVTVKTQLFGKATELPMHISTLSLLFRPAEWSNYGTPVITTADCPLEKRVEELCDLKIVPQSAQ